MISSKLLTDIVATYKLPLTSTHGLTHWKNVEKYGLLLAKVTGADPVVVTHFAYLHDSKRNDEEVDPNHGHRAAEYISNLIVTGRLSLNGVQIEQLISACSNHSSSLYKTSDITVATCIDADRLDLSRLGVSADPYFLLTNEAKRMLEISRA